MRIGSAVFVLSDPDGKMLFEERDDIGNFGRQWFFPAGKLNPGENPLSCLYREMEEELGLEPMWFEELAAVPRPVVSVSGQYLMKPFLVTQWLGEVPARTLDQHGRQLRWIDGPEVMETTTVEVVRAIAADALRVLRSRSRGRSS